MLHLVECVREIGQNLFVHSNLHLVRHPRHGTEQFFALVEYHKRCTPYPIGKYLCILRHEPLCGCKAIQHIGTIPIERENMAMHCFIDNELRIEIAAEDMLSNIVFCRPQTACGEHNIRMGKGRIECFYYVCRIVMYGSDLIERDATLVQTLCHPCRVGIYNLPDKEFITYRDYFCSHCFFHSWAVRHTSSYHACPKRRISGSLRKT